MTNILIRSGLSPLEDVSVPEIMCKNLLGNNVGNLIYAQSIYRTFMVDEDTNLIPDRYRLKLRNLDWINENCSMYLIPMADMFRPNARNYMKDTAEYIKKLKIPCHIIGVGLRAEIDDDLTGSFVFDEEVKMLLNAVLEKSDIIGIRGERTAKYLKRLGYIEDKHFMVIGCPSMYTYGATLKRKDIVLGEDAKISLNESLMCKGPALDFLKRVAQEYPDHYYLPQRLDELWILYTGRECKNGRLKNLKNYPKNLKDDYYREDRAKFFVTAKSWIDFLSGMNFSIGSRMHGNVAAVLAGTPAIWIPHDSRMMELIQYHHFPYVKESDLQDDWKLLDVIERVNLEEMYQYQKENFDRYISFLDRNEIPHIYKGGCDHVEDAPYDKALAQMKDKPAVKSAINLSLEEINARWVELYNVQTKNRNSIIEERKEDIERLRTSKNEEIRKLKREIIELKGQIKCLNETTIKEDMQLVGKKLKDKVAGNVKKNLEYKK